MPYGNDPEIAIDSATIARIAPHFLSASKPADATIPTIAAGQAKLKARLILAVCKGGPAKATRPIIGRAATFAISPNQVINQYPRTEVFIFGQLKNFRLVRA